MAGFATGQVVTRTYPQPILKRFFLFTCFSKKVAFILLAATLKLKMDLPFVSIPQYWCLKGKVDQRLQNMMWE